MARTRSPVGWSPDRSYHWTPGRLVVPLARLRGDRAGAQALEARLRQVPGVLQAQASALTGSVVLRYDERQVGCDHLLGLLRQPDPPAQPRRWAVSSLAPLGGVRPHRLAELVKAGAQWAALAGRRVLRRLLGTRALRTARLMQRRGEQVLCLVEDGQPRGLVGFRSAAVPEVAAALAEPAELGAPAWHATTINSSLERLGSCTGGLADAEAQARLRQFGPNALLERPGPSPWQLLLRQFKEPMVLVLLGAAALSLLLGERVDAIVIITIVAINALLAMGQEYKARATLDGLKRMTSATARTLRDGEVVLVPVEELVPGDVVLIESGDAVPADLRLVEGNNLLTEEAALTGESGEVIKDPMVLLEPSDSLGDRRNMAYMGTFLRGGRGRGVVVATGMSTEMGRIAGLLQEADPGPTPLQRRMAQVNRWLVLGGLAAGAVMVLVGLFQGLPGGAVLLTAISTAVAAIPEGLPITVTIALALAVHRMGRQGAVVRHLPSVEALGSTMTICTDKTGTLTCNQMTVRELWAGGRRHDPEDGPLNPEGDAATVLRMATLCSNASVSQGPDGRWTGEGDPTEVAILVAAAKGGLVQSEVHAAHQRLHERPFEAASRSMAVVCRDQHGRVYAHVKGAVDKVLDRCSRWHLHGVDEYLTAHDRRLIEQQADAMAAGALRVLAVAYKPLHTEWENESLEEGLVFAGLLGLMDPPRAEVRGALERCRKAGVQVMMVTGDHPRTALAIARDLGLIDQHGQALTGADMDAMADAELAAALESTAVCARVAPEQKLRIVRALRSRGRVVAMTGDGVNDAPAIREADIGIAMGRSGTEVTRATADVVLMDDNFATIVNAIEEGRGTYDNIRRTVRYTLATNIAEVVLMLGAVLAGVPLPLLPVHLLWVNLVCDGVPALSLAFDRPAAGALDRPPVHAADGLFSGGLWRRMAARGVALGGGILALFGGVLAFTGDIVLARSAAVAALILSKMLYLLEVRRDESGARGLSRNPVLSWALAGTAALLLGTLYLPGLQQFFRTTAIGPTCWLGVAAVAVVGALVERSAANGSTTPGPKEATVCVSSRLSY